MADRARELRRNRMDAEKRHPATGQIVSRSGESRERVMIEATRLNGEKIYLNIIQIECMESIPETKIKMMNGDYFLVKDSVDSIIYQMKALANSVLSLDDNIRKN